MRVALLRRALKRGLALYYAQLGLNFIYTPIFLGAQQVRPSFCSASRDESNKACSAAWMVTGGQLAYDLDQLHNERTSFIY